MKFGYRPAKIIATIASMSALICTILAILTGNYSTSERYGWIAFTMSCCAAVNWVIWGITYSSDADIAKEKARWNR